MQTFACKYFSKQNPWLVGIAFLLSAALFTGYTGRSSNPLCTSIQTCWNFTNDCYWNKKKVVTYNSPADATHETKALVQPALFKFALRHFSNITQIKITSAGKIFCTIKSTHFIVAKNKTILSSDEPSLFSFA